jgi:ribosomal protein S18 acetylase RimI-like enzyme
LEIIEISEMTGDVANCVRKLLPQLSSSAAAPSDDLVGRIVGSDSARLLFAYDNGVVVGMLTIAIFPIPSGVRAWIEDVVVDEAGRGKGIGEMLNRAAIKLAEEEGARTVDLTSRPSREAANRLYQRIGFVQRQTNVYRLDVGQQRIPE